MFEENTRRSLPPGALGRRPLFYPSRTYRAPIGEERTPPSTTYLDFFEGRHNDVSTRIVGNPSIRDQMPGGQRTGRGGEDPDPPKGRRPRPPRRSSRDGHPSAPAITRYLPSLPFFPLWQENPSIPSSLLSSRGCTRICYPRDFLSPTLPRRPSAATTVHPPRAAPPLVPTALRVGLSCASWRAPGIRFPGEKLHGGMRFGVHVVVMLCGSMLLCSWIQVVEGASGVRHVP